MKRALLFANTEWYLYNFRLSLARALQAAGYEVILISPPGPYGHKLRELGLDWRPAPMARLSLNPFSELRLLWWLIGLLRLIPGSGVDLTRFKPAEAKAERTVSDPFRIVLPARLRWDKGIAEWVAGAQKLKSIRPQITLLLECALFQTVMTFHPLGPILKCEQPSGRSSV